MQTTTCKRAACGLAVPPYQRAKPIYLPSNATDASRGRPPAFFETLMGGYNFLFHLRVSVSDSVLSRSTVDGLLAKYRATEPGTAIGSVSAYRQVRRRVLRNRLKCAQHRRQQDRIQGSNSSRLDQKFSIPRQRCLAASLRRGAEEAVGMVDSHCLNLEAWMACLRALALY